MLGLQIAEQSQIGEARRQASDLCYRYGYDEAFVGKVSLVATEMATNLVKHAGQGLLLLRLLGAESGEAAGVEIISLDRGPGLSDPGQCMQDGYSATGSLGTGLGAVARLSHCFDIYSSPGQGTAVLSQIRNRSGPATRSPLWRGSFLLGAVCLPPAGEEACGDSWAIAGSGQRLLLGVCDGLGHGPVAAEASAAALRAFQRHSSMNPAAIMESIHAALETTRGAAVAIAEINTRQRVCRYAAVGNISGHLIAPDGSRQSLISHNGTAGAQVRRIQEFSYDWPTGGLLAMHSDGLSARWALEHYPGLQAKHPSLIAGILYRDYQRDRDDSAVIVAREGANHGRALDAIQDSV